MADLHPEVEKAIEAGPHKTPLVHNGCTIDHIYETPKHFARRIAALAVEKEREALRNAFTDVLIEMDATWSVGEARLLPPVRRTKREKNEAAES